MSTVPLFFDIHNYPLLSLYHGTRLGLYRDSTGTLPACPCAAQARALPRAATAASWACYGLAMGLLPVRGAGTRPTARGHCRELGLLWACCGLAVDSTARRSPLGCRGVGVSGCRGVGVSGCRGVGMSGCRGVGVSGCGDFLYNIILIFD